MGELLRMSPDPQSVTNLFESFWLLYPRKEGKKECRLVWDRIPESEHIPILEAVVAWRAAWVAQGRSTNYIKMPREWLILERWNDEIPIELQVRAPSTSVPRGSQSISAPSGGEANGGGNGAAQGRLPIPAHVQAVIDRLKAKRKC